MYKVYLCLFLLLSCASPNSGQSPQSKADLTPTFCQRDPEADFEDEGRMHCAPTAFSDGLIYLEKACGMKGLVPGTDHKSQIDLINTLAEEFQTDPSIGGTNPDRVMTGLQSYVQDQGYGFSRLEVMTWRSLSAANKKFKTGTKPDLAWMRSAARSKDTVMVFNFGWYQGEEDGYIRKGGHWVIVVGASSDSSEFFVHNPILPADQQARKTSVTLSRLDEDFTVLKDDDEANMIGYYQGEGPGLPHGAKVEAAILDAVIVFSLKK